MVLITDVSTQSNQAHAAQIKLFGDMMRKVVNVSSSTTVAVEELSTDSLARKNAYKCVLQIGNFLKKKLVFGDRQMRSIA